MTCRTPFNVLGRYPYLAFKHCRDIQFNKNFLQTPIYRNYEHCYAWTLKFSNQIHLTRINTISEYCHALVNLDNVDVLY